MNQKPQLIAQGAEAKIYLFNSTISKKRIPKTYRHKQLDKQIRTRRTRSEAKILKKANDLKINTPKLISSNIFDIEIKYINGDQLSKNLNSYSKEKQFETMRKLGFQTALLHKNNIIHGDLTTSNVILQKGKVFLIDFGLSFISIKIEDKAVDLHLIKQALEAKHFQNHKELFKYFLKEYDLKDREKILERLRLVEKRGRYRH